MWLETSRRPPGGHWDEAVAAVRDLAPEVGRAVIGYGSWMSDALRGPVSFPDLYLVVESSSRFHRSAFHALMNAALPPNVYFLWREEEGRREIRGKYNVIGAPELERECGPGMRDLYNAGRLTKRVWLAWTRDDATTQWLARQIVRAHLSLTPIALALVRREFGVADFSRELLGLSYRAEARLEGWEKVRALYAAHEAHYRALHPLLLAAYAEATGLIRPAGEGFRKESPSEWAAIARSSRRLLRRSRLRGYLRWPRIMLTEPHLLDLAANEAERKAGVRIRVTPRLRRHPLLFGLPEFLRVLRARRDRERIDPWG